MSVNWNATEIAYGGDYNPEQWDEATFEDDLERFTAAGVNLVSLGIFSWSLLEPEEGHYDFDWLASIMDRLHQRGIKVDLANASASPPVWLAQKYPQTLPQDARGTVLGFGSRQQYCPSSPIYRDRAQRLTRALAQRFGSHPALVMWHINNEYGCHISECFCPESVVAWQNWLRRRYTDIEALNQSWGTNFWSQRYTHFSQVGAPAAMPTIPNPGQFLDWRRFGSDQLLECYLAEAKILRQYTPNIAITTNFMEAFPPMDYWKWAQHVDVIADDSYPDPATPTGAAQVAFASDLMRSLGGGKPFFLMEQTTSAVQWRERNSPKRPGQFQQWSIARIARGADAILQFQWRASKAGAETFHAGMVPHSGSDSRTWKETVQLGQTLKKLAPVCGSKIDTPVAIVFDWESNWARECACGPTNDSSLLAARRWHRTCFEAGYTVDFVRPDADLTGYKVVLVPEIFAADQVLADRLSEAAKKGTEVVISGPTAVTDKRLHAWLGGYLGPLRDLLGVRVLDHYALSGQVAVVPGAEPVDPRVDRLTAHIGVPAAECEVPLDPQPGPLMRALDAIGRPRPALRGLSWAEETQVTSPDVKVMAQWANAGGCVDLAGGAAITRRKVDAGGAWYVATDLDGASRAAILAVACAYGRAVPPVPDLPAGVDGVRRGDVTFLMNYSDRAVELAGFTGMDLISGLPAQGHLVLAPRSSAAICPFVAESPSC